MKKTYSAPSIVFEVINLNQAIAAGCSYVIDFGPEMPGHEVCEGFEIDFGKKRSAAGAKGSLNTNFYEDGSCSCYLSSAGGGYALS